MVKMNCMHSLFSGTPWASLGLRGQVWSPPSYNFWDREQSMSLAFWSLWVLRDRKPMYKNLEQPDQKKVITNMRETDGEMAAFFLSFLLVFVFWKISKTYKDVENNTLISQCAHPLASTVINPRPSCFIYKCPPVLPSFQLYCFKTNPNLI